MEAARPHARILGLFKRLAPWVVAITILAVIISRVPFAAFRGALGRGPHVLLATVNLCVVLCTLMTDTFATWVSLIALRLRRPFWHVMAVRGATYVLSLVNYALGQGGFGYYLHRTGARPLRAVGATLFLMGTNLATLLVLSWVTSTLIGGDHESRMWWTLLAGCAGYLVYLAIIALRPGFLARREALAPLFDAGLRGHAFAMLGRLPHVTVMVMGFWVAFRAWGIAVPFGVGLTVLPFAVIASAVPIAPAGLGTTQAVLVYFLGTYAAGGTPDERNASLLAFAMVYFVYGVLAWLAVGLACVPFARRVDKVTPPAAT